MTEKLYYKDSYIKEFEVKVIKVTELENGYGIVLDRTAFFPEGGGQYGDIGTIGDAKITDTFEKDGVIYHVANSKLTVGSTVIGRLDWKKRYSKMQNHTGEHLLCGIMHNKYGFNNVGFHLSDTDVTLDIDGKLSAEEVKAVERAANDLIDENLKINVLYPSTNELEAFEYRSKLDLTEDVRLVEIQGHDLCACCAPHVNTLSEVVVVKIIRAYNYKAGMRFHIACGARAREDYVKLADMNTAITNALSVKRYECLEAFERLNEELTATKHALCAMGKLACNSIVENSTDGLFFVDEQYELDLVYLANKGAQRFDLCAVFFGNDKNGYRYLLSGVNAKAAFEAFKTAFNAKGGGKDIYQGRVSATEDKIREFFK